MYTASKASNLVVMDGQAGAEKRIEVTVKLHCSFQRLYYISCSAILYIATKQLCWAALWTSCVVIAQHMGLKYGYGYTGTTQVFVNKRTILFLLC